jgi:hypothetical protein
MLDFIYMALPNAELENTYSGYTDFFNRAQQAIEKHHLFGFRTREFPDIFVRDFMPFQDAPNGDWVFMKSNHTDSMQKLYPKTKRLDVELDGGNFVANGYGLAFTFANGIKAKLERELGYSAIYELPPPPISHNPLCHIDDFMQFLGDDILMVNAPYDDITRNHYNQCTEIIRNIAPELKIINLPVEIAAGQDMISTRGIYVNFLETSDAVFVPQYNKPADAQILKIIRANTEKPITGIDCEKIAAYGGSLHRLIRNYLFNSQREKLLEIVNLTDTLELALALNLPGIYHDNDKDRGADEPEWVFDEEQISDYIEDWFNNSTDEEIEFVLKFLGSIEYPDE